jgi:hypothetical protein
MNAEPDMEALERRIDSALGRLPNWDPPAEFSRRLAAAAHRQHGTLGASRPSTRFGLLLGQLGELALVIVMGCLIAALLTFAVPWQLLVSQPLQLTLLCLIAMLIAGAALTRQLWFHRLAGGW